MTKKEKEEEEFPNEIILEVRAGAGGDEASLFAWQLAHMYERFAEKEKWQWREISGHYLTSLEDEQWQVARAWF